MELESSGPATPYGSRTAAEEHAALRRARAEHPAARAHMGNGTVRPLRDAASVGCDGDVELVVRSMSFGRIAHFRRSLLAVRDVRSVRIAGYARHTALFVLTVTPGTTSGALALPGTRLIGSDGRRVELCVDVG